jgi:3-methyladenine DNA glycosylase AlkD
MSFITELEFTFDKNRNPENAVPMAKYMKNLFPFYGIKTEQRRFLFKKVCKANKEELTQNSREIAWKLFNKEFRELHYCGIEIVIKNLKNNYQNDDINLIEKLLTTKSWWDSVDTISKFVLGEYLNEFTEETTKVVERFSNSKNMWLNRSVLLFQLGYKNKTNAEILFTECKKHSHSKEFFIQKAIGWALREYASTNPELVKTFVNSNDLKPLSKKEALRKLI